MNIPAPPVSPESVSLRLLQPEQLLPLVVEPAEEDVDLTSWIMDNRDWIDERVNLHGAILFRGFAVETLADFEDVIVAASSDDWVDYREAATPRSHVEGHVFTSTEYSAANRIYLHNENSHTTTFPGKLFFHCRTAAETGGETPLADCRRVFNRIPAEIRAPFLEKGWTYLRTFGFGLGFPWQKVFNATTKDEVEAYCRENFMRAKWEDGDRLRVAYRRWAAVTHPQTGEQTWFNHGTFYNIFTLEPELKAVLKTVGADNMPYNTCYGDGSPIDESVLAALDAAYEAETIAFPWEPRDVVLLDNMLVAHGRAPFTGKREVFVGMTELMRCEDLFRPDEYAPPA